MFPSGQITPEQIPEVVRQTFDGYRTLLGITEKAMAILKSPAMANMSRTEFLATVDSWEQQVKLVSQNVPLRAKP